MRRAKPLALVITLSMLVFVHVERASGAEAAWPNWRGPDNTGVAPAADPPTEWSAGKNVKWKVDLPGEGHATPIVWGDRIYLLAAVDTGRKPAPSPARAEEDAEAADDGDERRERPRPRFGGGEPPATLYRFVVLCLERATGKVVWDTVATEQVPHQGVHSTSAFAAASPVTDGKHIYASFGSRGVYCLDLAGKIVWKRDLGQMDIIFSFGEGASPALRGDTLVVPWDHQGESAVYALDAATGDIRWQRPREERASWATPLVVARGSGAQVVLSASERVRSYALESGELLWECGGQTGNVIPTPVSDGERIFCISGFRGSALYAIPLDAEGDLTDKDAEIAWHHEGDTPYVPSPVLYDGLLLFTKGNGNVITCLDAATGKRHFGPQRLPLGDIYASPVGAGGRIYIVDREGKCVVLKRGTEFEVLAENTIGEPVDASPVAVDGQLLLRSHRRLWCFEEAGATGS